MAARIGLPAFRGGLVSSTVAGQAVTSQINLLIAEKRMLMQSPDMTGVLEQRGRLRDNAIGLKDAVIVGMASSGPTASIALTLAAIVSAANYAGPIAILVCALPMVPWSSMGGTNGLVGGILIAVYMFSGWDTSVYVNEETRDSRVNPGRAVLISVIGTTQTALVSGARIAFAMGGDGTLPRALGRAHPLHRTPALATVQPGQPGQPG
jgi:amino acid transporter